MKQFILLISIFIGATQLLAQEPDTFSVRSEIKFGEKLTHAIGRGFSLVLNPAAQGWTLEVIKDSDSTHTNLAARTEPLHGINATQIEGWHFRNSDNTGPNLPGPKNVNAPGEFREFQFCESPQALESFFAEARCNQSGGANCRNPMPCSGHGVLKIERFTLGNLNPQSKARFESMNFRVSGGFVWRDNSPRIEE